MDPSDKHWDDGRLEMKLDEYVKQTLLDITKDVTEAQKFLSFTLHRDDDSF